MRFHVLWRRVFHPNTHPPAQLLSVTLGKALLFYSSLEPDAVTRAAAHVPAENSLLQGALLRQQLRCELSLCIRLHCNHRRRRRRCGGGCRLPIPPQPRKVEEEKSHNRFSKLPAVCEGVTKLSQHPARNMIAPRRAAPRQPFLGDFGVRGGKLSLSARLFRLYIFCFELQSSHSI